MNKKIRMLTEVFRDICLISEDGEKEKEVKRKQLEAWFVLANQVGLKQEIGLVAQVGSIVEGENRTRCFYFVYLDLFEGINISILFRSGGKQKIFQLSHIVELPQS